MTHPYDHDLAEQIAAKATARIKEFGLTYTPDNFKLCFEYAAGHNERLVETIDGLVASGLFDDEQARRIYTEFFIEADLTAQTFEASEKIETTASEIVESMTSFKEDTDVYSEALGTFSGSLSQSSDLNSLEKMVDRVLNNTQMMDSHIHLLQTKIQNASQEISSLKQKLAESRREANTDMLTGVRNRQFFDRAIEEVIRFASTEGEPMALILMDLDGFKAFNEAHGRQAGDAVLRLVGQCLHRSVKGQDVAARYGGDEFAIILPITDLHGATSLAESIRTTIAGKKLVRKGTTDEIGSISVSVGVSEFCPGEEAVTLIARAEDALDKAKSAGGNTVSTDSVEALVISV